MLTILEKSIFSKINKLIVTSERFYDRYYIKLIKKDNVVFIPNIPNLDAFKSYQKRIRNKKKFTVGFIGGIRYLSQIKMLVDVAEITQINILLAGAGGNEADYKEILNYCQDKKYVKFTGKYDYIKQIASLYEMVDCIYAVYDADNPNVKIALPNKLYEAIYCELPIIVAKETYLSEIVDKWGIGVSVDHKSPYELQIVIENLVNNLDYYHSFKKALNKYKLEVCSEKYNNLLENIFKDYLKVNCYSDES